MVDIDHLKKVNDIFGHDCDVQVLIAVAETLQESFRDSDIVARCCREELVIMTPNITVEHIQDPFEAVCRKIKALTIKTARHEIQTTVSIVVTTKQQTTLEAAVKTADDLLYQAKASGRNCCLLK